VDRYRESYPQYFALLPDNLVETIEFVISINVLWGWESPGEEDIRDVCLAAARRITTEEQLDSALAGLRRSA
jgi:hypothetical protein